MHLATLGSFRGLRLAKDGKEVGGKRLPHLPQRAKTMGLSRYHRFRVQDRNGVLQQLPSHRTSNTSNETS